MRIQIFDTTCVVKHGHNFPALMRYSNILNNSGLDLEVDLYVCKDFSEENSANVFSVLPHSYGFNGLKKLDNPIFETYESFMSNIDDDACTTVFFPNIDFVSIKAFQEIFSNKEKTKARYILRFIGVMENDCLVEVSIDRALHEIKELCLIAKENNIDLTLGCETLEYSRYVSSVINSKVEYMPFPLENKSLLVKERSKKFTIGFLGAASAYKGYFDILDIVEGVNRELDSAAVQFIVQPENENGDFEYKRKLENIANVTFLEPFPIHSELLEWEMKCDLFILPYQKDIYKHRGSAMLFEGLEFSIPSITHDGVAFSEDISKYNIGFVVKNLKNIEKIDSIIKKVSSGELKSKIEAYIAYTHKSFVDLIRN